ncbi:MAG: hypothetical protein JSW65_04120, partial [Candidatus Bipolaricaulota bacterium]
VQGADVAMDDVDRRGIRDVSAADVIAAQREGERVRLVATSEATGDSFRLRVTPSRIDRGHPLAGLGSNGMGIVFTTDLYGVISMTIREPDPVPSAATMLRDVLDIYVGPRAAAALE